MSTVPRVPSAIPGEPATLRSALAHCPDLAAAFHRLYGTMWSDGIVAQSIKETARMRNARVTDCGFCKNVRFDGALADGLDEAQVDLIHDGYESSALSDDQKLVLRYTDAFLIDPGRVDDALRDDMAARFSDAEIVELTLALALFLGMAKVLISLGTEPEEMERTVVPTPALARAR
jgi:alkylhydroperoxidase family enzyme